MNPATETALAQYLAHGNNQIAGYHRTPSGRRPGTPPPPPAASGSADAG